MDAGDAWGRSSSSSSSSAAAARRLQSRYDLYMGFDEDDAAGVEEVEARGGEAYNCPFCGEDFDFVAFCCHVDDEHAVEAKSGVCPICATRVGADLIGHLTMQHGNEKTVERYVTSSFALSAASLRSPLPQYHCIWSVDNSFHVKTSKPSKDHCCQLVECIVT
uniref:Di19 zinc-binding domain-containing protein n=1 Tax=Leersia perrieri TaxID=77586 RepID=A0A0D9WFJ3_9ORYZ